MRKKRALTALMVAIGWIAFIGFVGKSSSAAEAKRFCTTYKITDNWCTPGNGAALTKCEDWNAIANQPNCATNGRELEQVKKQECKDVPSWAQPDWMFACVDAKESNGQPKWETCSVSYACELITISTVPRPC